MAGGVLAVRRTMKALRKMHVTTRCSFFFSSRRRHTRLQGDWSSDVCSSDLLKQSANARYLVDQNNAPYLILGDSPQALIVNLTTNEAAAFFADRAAHGFNTL